MALQQPENTHFRLDNPPPAAYNNERGAPRAHDTIMRITVPLSLEVDVPDQEGVDYYLNADGTATIAVIADIFDILGDVASDPIVKINGKTQEDVRALMHEALP